MAETPPPLTPDQLHACLRLAYETVQYATDLQSAESIRDRALIFASFLATTEAQRKVWTADYVKRRDAAGS